MRSGEFKAEDITQLLSDLKESNDQKDRILVKDIKRRIRQLNIPRAITDTVDDMGGTLGAILGIRLTAFNNALKRQFTSQEAVTTAIFSDALGTAVESLKVYTTARGGDRTVMDVLIPFTDEFVQRRSFEAAMRKAKEKAEATRFLKSKLGRALYVGEASEQQVPDPGAWALYEMLGRVELGLGLGETWKLKRILYRSKKA